MSVQKPEQSVRLKEFAPDANCRHSERHQCGGPRSISRLNVAQETLAETNHALEVHKIELELQNLELRRAQEALEISLARYCDLYELAPVSFITLNELGRVVDINRKATRLLGTTKDKLLGISFNRHVHSEDQDLLYLRSRQLFRSGHPQAFELRLRKADGGSVLVWTELSPAQDDQGTPVCRVVMSDITDRRRQEMHLRLQSSALNRDSRDVLLADSQGTIEWVNEAFCKTTGYCPQEVTGKSLQEQVRPAAGWDVAPAGGPWHGEVTLGCKDGRVCRRHLALSPVKDLFGKNTHCIAHLGGGARPLQVETPALARTSSFIQDDPGPELARPERRSLKRGRILFREGDIPRLLFQVHSGCMKLSRASLIGRDLIVELLYPGDYFDIYSLLHGGPTLFTAASLNGHPAQVNCLPKSTVLRDAELMKSLKQQIVSRMRQQQEMMAALATLRVDQRVLLALQLLARREGKRRGEEMVISVPLTRQELGEMIGASAEASIRALTQLKRRGVIDWEERKLICQANLLENPSFCLGGPA